MALDLGLADSASATDVARAIALRMARKAAETRGKIRRHRDGRLYVDFGEGARVWSFPLHQRSIRLTQELAEEVLAYVRTELGRGRELLDALADFEPRYAKPNLVTTRLERWRDVKEREAKAGDLSWLYYREIERWTGNEGHIGAFWGGRSILEITEATLEDWALWLADRKTARGRPLSPATRSRVLGGFHSFLGWLYRRRELREMPRSYPWPRVPEREPRLLSATDQDAVLAAIPQTDRGIFLALAHCGLRPSEARALEVADYRDGSLVIEKKCAGPNQDSPVRMGTKNRWSRTVPVSDELAGWIQQHVPREARLQRRRLFVVSTTGGAWSQWTLADRWRAACKAVGVTGVSLYPGTKHTMATDALRRGVPERTIQAMLGHADPKSTRRYARLADGALVQVVRRDR